MALKSFALLLAQSGVVELRLSRTDTGFSALVIPSTPVCGDTPSAEQAALLAALAKPILISEPTLEALESALDENVPKMAVVRQSPIDDYAAFVEAQKASATSAKASRKAPAAPAKAAGKAPAATSTPAAEGDDEDAVDAATADDNAAPAAGGASGETGSLFDAAQATRF